MSDPAPASLLSSFPRAAVMWLARADVVFYTLIWMMVILVVGTIAQKYVGLYLSQQKIFYAWIIWAGPVPLPGGMPAMVVLTLGLMAKLVFKSSWTLVQSGIIITHLGALLLMLGGFLTYVQSREGNMALFPGEKSAEITDYHARELVVRDAETDAVLVHVPFDQVRTGYTFAVPDSPLRVEIVKSCRSCTFVPRDKDDPQMPELRGRAVNFDIAPTHPALNDEENVAAAQFRLSGSDADGIHFSTEMINVAPHVMAGGKTYTIAVRRERRPLPFEIELVNFEKQVHPGTEMARSYQSEVIVREKDQQWRGMIKMNEPLRYRGYTFYQSSFISDGDRSGSVFAVVKNAGRMFPYISSIIMCIGLLIHLMIQLPRLIKRGTAAGILLLALMMPAQAWAETPDLHEFRSIPVQHEGRIKPMDTFARSMLEVFTGRDTLPDGRAADAWLLSVIMAPDQSFDTPLFRVTNRNVQQMLGLSLVKGHRYSYHTLTEAFHAHSDVWQAALRTDEKQRTQAQKQMLELLKNIDLYMQLSQSLTAIAPDFVIDDEKLARKLEVTPGAQLTYLDLRGKQAALAGFADALAARLEKTPAKKSDAVTLSPTDQAVLATAGRLKFLDQNAENTLFRVLPPTWHLAGDEWQSPWASVLQGKSSPQTTEALAMWQRLLVAYRGGNDSDFQVQAAALRTTASHDTGKISLELLFNDLAPFNKSFALYLAGLLALGASFIMAPRLLVRVALITVGTALALHIGGIVMRMIIMERPPVTNLYSSVLFVGMIGAALGLLLEQVLRNRLGLMIAALCGSVLQLVGMRFDAEGDQMGMLVAVLDTNFWLATHVVVITLGYAAALVAGVMGHVYLAQRLFLKDSPLPAQILRNMMGVALLTILLTAIGTILGGIWADQSWGRFWGWDPKENGALLIVLWFVWLMHGKHCGLLRNDGYAAAMALAFVVVAAAWFGVNLLSVGLHSYGFTESARTGFTVFTLADTALVLAAYTALRLRDAEARP